MNVFFTACLVCTLSQYSPDVMDEVVDNRIGAGLLGAGTHADGYLAVRDCEHIGKVVWLRPIGQEEWEKFIVADCAASPGTDGAYEWMTSNRIVGEVDHETAARWGVVGRAARAQVKAPGAPTLVR